MPHVLLRSQNPGSKTIKHPGFGSKEPMEDVQEYYVSVSWLAPLCYHGDRRIALLLILPAIQITCFAAIVGGDMKDVKLLNTNHDNCKYCSSNVAVESLRQKEQVCEIVICTNKFHS